MSRVSSLLIVLLWFQTPAIGISVHLSGHSESTPFDFTYLPSEFPINVELQLDNAASTPVSVLAWQLELAMQPVGAQGSLAFLEVHKPSNPLYDQEPDPQCIPELPPASVSIITSDADMTDPFEGAPLGESPRNIVKLTISASPNTSGAFQLVMRDFDQDTANGSAWVDANDASGTPIPFDNTAESSLSGFRLLGNIHVQNQLGDYNGSGTVEAADYATWRETFDTSAAAWQGADGNGNGRVDAADYVIWRRYFTSSSALLLSASVPEPSAFIYAMLGFGPFGLMRLRGERCHVKACRRRVVKQCPPLTY
jgi:hypothetical protein